MIIVTNDKRARRSRLRRSVTLLANTALFLMLLFGILILLVARYLPQYANSPMLLIGMGVLSSIVGLLSGKSLSNPVSVVDSLEQGLKGFGDDSLLLNFVGPPDHVLICPHGIFALAAFSQPLDILADGSTLRIRNRALQRFIWFFTGNTIGRPFEDATEIARRSTDWIQTKTQLSHEPTIQPIIILTHPDAHIESNDPLIPILYTDKRTPNLKQFVRRTSVTTPDLSTIDQLITTYTSVNTPDD
jgi:hypothetical protein